MVRTEFALPDVGEGVAEGELVTWFIELGEYVEEEQPIAEVETDKALVEIPSPYDGVVEELCAEEGETILVDEVLVVFDVDVNNNDDASSEGGSTKVGPDEAGDSTASGGESTVEASEADSDDADAPSIPAGRVLAPPSVRRLARERGVDLAALQGRNPNGRLSKRDVREAAGESVAGADQAASESVVATDDDEPARADAEATAESSPGVDRDDPWALTSSGGAALLEGIEPASRERTLAMPATRQLAREEGVDIDDIPASEQRVGEAYVTPADIHAYVRGDRTGAAGTEPAAGGMPEPAAGRSDASDGPAPGDQIPYAGVRRTIGERMAASKYTAPHVSHHDEVEVSALVDTRARLKETAKERGVKLTYLPFAVKAVVAALKEVPTINAKLDEEREEILLHDEYHVGTAVATDAGLMVPVIEDADRKGLLKIAREIENKARRSRERTIGVEELRGGTFTITNIGATGGDHATPIINHPESGILALGALKERPWAENGEIVVRPTLPISMSVDHRVVDGAEAARFTNEVKRYLTEPDLLLLE
nr:2-oxo acid dehydrogenase subunit E2 [Natrinema gelatinilyticum]